MSFPDPTNHPSPRCSFPLSFMSWPTVPQLLYPSLNLPHSQVYKPNVCILLSPLVFYWCQSRSPSPDTMWKLFTKRVAKIQTRVKKMCDPYPKCKCSKETMSSLIQHSSAKYWGKTVDALKTSTLILIMSNTERG